MSKPPANHSLNEKAVAAAKARGWPLTVAAIADAAALAQIPLWVRNADRRPDGHITNFAVLAEARRLGLPITPASLAEVASFSGLPLWVTGTDSGVEDGMREIANARRAAELEKQSQRYWLESGLLEPETAA